VSRVVTLLEFRTLAREATGTVGNSFIGDDWLTDRANQHLTDVWDRIVDAGPPERYAATETFTEVAGTPSVPTPASFRNLLDIYLVDSGGYRTRLDAMRGGTRGNYRAPTTAYTVEVEYIPAPDVLVADGDSFDGISGWEELVVLLMARDICKKRDVDPSAFLADIEMMKARIDSRARSYDKGSPKFVTDLDDIRPGWPWSSAQRITTYRLRGDNIELYESAWP
jgi:hypothetical protein